MAANLSLPPRRLLGRQHKQGVSGDRRYKRTKRKRETSHSLGGAWSGDDPHKALPCHRVRTRLRRLGHAGVARGLRCCCPDGGSRTRSRLGRGGRARCGLRRSRATRRPRPGHGRVKRGHAMGRGGSCARARWTNALTRSGSRRVERVEEIFILERVGIATRVLPAGAVRRVRVLGLAAFTGELADALLFLLGLRGLVLQAVGLARRSRRNFPLGRHPARRRQAPWGEIGLQRRG
jgi:hypothetical protein